MPENPLSLYLHIPFCTHRCAYCDFNTYAEQEDLIPAYCQALRQELRLVARSLGSQMDVHTVFFGGGTPSLLPAAEIGQVLDVIREHFVLLPEAELSLEANPGTISEDYLRKLCGLGINRLSLGVQSANFVELQVLERQHDYIDVIQAVRAARRAGFANINMDLIFGLPDQKLDSWQHTLELAVDLRPEHLALYALTLEHGTPMQRWTKRGLLPEPDPDLAADMYEHAARYLARAGYEQYEISNWAITGRDGEDRQCRHNLQYWRGQAYLGFGAGAHGYAAGVRTANVLAPQAYIQRCLEGAAAEFPRSPANVQAVRETPSQEMGSFMMMGLRLTQEGVADETFQQRFGIRLEDTYGSQIDRFVRLGLLEWTTNGGKRLRLTESGRLLGNQVFQEFI